MAVGGMLGLFLLPLIPLLFAWPYLIFCEVKISHQPFFFLGRRGTCGLIYQVDIFVCFFLNTVSKFLPPPPPPPPRFTNFVKHHPFHKVPRLSQKNDGTRGWHLRNWAGSGCSEILLAYLAGMSLGDIYLSFCLEGVALDAIGRTLRSRSGIYALGGLWWRSGSPWIYLVITQFTHAISCHHITPHRTTSPHTPFPHGHNSRTPSFSSNMSRNLFTHNMLIHNLLTKILS